MALDDKAVNLRDLKVSHDDLDGKVTDLKSDLNYAETGINGIGDYLGKRKELIPAYTFDGKYASVNASNNVVNMSTPGYHNVAIDVSNLIGTKVFMTNTLTSASYPMFCLVADASNNVLLYLNDSDDLVHVDYPLTIPSTAKYLYVNSVDNTDIIVSVYDYTGDNLPTLLDTEFDEINNHISFVNTIEMQVSYIDANKYATISGGRVGETSRTGCTSVLYPVSELIGEKLLLTTITDVYPYSIPYLFADSESNPIEYLPASQTTSFSDYAVTVPENAKWMYVNVKTGSAYSVAKNSILFLSDVAEVDLINSSIRGKNCVCFGDSITWYDGHPYTNGKYQGDIAVGYESYMRQAGMNVNNQGYSGAHIRNIINEKVLPFDFTGYDYVTLTSGANDSRYEIPIGSLSSTGSTFDTSFIGRLQAGIEHILTSNPEIKILLITPIRGWIYGNGYYVPKAEDGVVSEAYAQAIKDVAEFYALPVCDWYADCGVNIFTRSWFMNDPEPDTTVTPNPNDQYSLHPTAKGYKRMADLLLPVLRSI